MRRTLEPVPELRAPQDWEHELVDRTLINRYRAQTKQGIQWPSVMGCVVGVMLIGNIVSGTASLGAVFGLLLMVLFCFYLTYASNKVSGKMKRLVECMERREYQLAQAWAVGIRCVTGEGKQEAYGLAHVRLENGQMLRDEYVLPYDYAADIVRRKITGDQKVLLVCVPQLNKYRLVPISNHGQPITHD